LVSFSCVFAGAINSNCFKSSPAFSIFFFRFSETACIFIFSVILISLPLVLAFLIDGSKLKKLFSSNFDFS